MYSLPRRLPVMLLAALMPLTGSVPAMAQLIPAANPPSGYGAPKGAGQAADGPTYADLVALADSAPLVVHARIRKMARVEDARMRPPAAGTGRFYIQAETRALITGRSAIGQSFAYLVDLPLDAKGRPRARKKDEVIVFARAVPQRPEEVQLVRPDAQIAWSPEVEARLKPIITALLAPDAPGKVTGVREMSYVPGNLAGEGETQIFLNTADNSAASVTVRHQPGQPPQWGASFSELVAQVGRPPAPETLEWYRLACGLPPTPAGATNGSDGPAAQAMAEADYRFVIEALGPCRRSS